MTNSNARQTQFDYGPDLRLAPHLSLPKRMCAAAVSLRSSADAPGAVASTSNIHCKMGPSVSGALVVETSNLQLGCLYQFTKTEFFGLPRWIRHTERPCK